MINPKKFAPSFLIFAFYLLSVAFLIYLAIFPQNDLFLSSYFKNPNNIFGVFFEFFGFWPYRLGILLFSSILIFHRDDVQNKRVSTTLLLLGLFGMVSQSFIFSSSVVYYISDYLGLELQVPYIFVLTAIMLTFGIAFGKKIKPKNIEVMRLIGVALVFYLFFNLLICDSLKLLWGRMRPTELSENLIFTPWHLPQGINGNKAFPSGHAMHGCVLFIISYILFKFDPKWFSRGKTLLILSMVWSFCVAVSRVVVGAHYPSDIIAGLVLGVTCVIISIIIPTKHTKILEFRILPFIMLLVGIGSLIGNIIYRSG